MRTLVLIAVLFFAAPAFSNAEQYVTGNQVVHTRLAPVVAHRILPPFKGIHVYGRRTTRR